MEGRHAQFSHTFSLGCGLRSSKPGEEDTDGEVTVERECSNVSFGFPFFTLKCKGNLWLVGGLNEVYFMKYVLLLC